MSHEEFEARVGTTLRGKWTLDRLIGVGGMAAVYAATHKIGRTDAIKLLDPEVAVSEDVRARFEQEALAVHSIGHPGTVEIRDIDVTSDGTPFLVMELLEGQTLAERGALGPYADTDDLLRLVDELLDVLVAAHAKGIIHRDIKPENLFVQRDGSLKVLDFGIARMRDGVVRTQVGTMLGTVAYMPPEQIKGEPVDRRADLFSVGATMFRLLSGRPVHQAEDEWKVGTKMLTEPAPPLLSVAADVPERIAWIVDRALAFHRGRRYPNAATMRADVRAVRHGDDPPYALARLESGDDPHSTEPDPQEAAPESGRPSAQDDDAPLRTAPTRSDAPPPPQSPDGKVTQRQRLGLERTKRGMPPAEPARPKKGVDTPDDGPGSAAGPEDAERAEPSDPQPPGAPAPPAGPGPKVAPTNPQLPAFLDARGKGGGPGGGGRAAPRQVPPTDPQMPAFAAADAGPEEDRSATPPVVEATATKRQEPAFAEADRGAERSEEEGDGEADPDDGEPELSRRAPAARGPASSPPEPSDSDPAPDDASSHPSAEGEEPEEPESGPSASVAPRRGGASRLRLVLLLLVVAAAAAGGWWWHQQRSRPVHDEPSSSSNQAP